MTAERETMTPKFIVAARVQSAPFQPKKWMFLRHVFVDIDGTLYTKPDYPPPPAKGNDND
jgi:hypothetical protein